MKTKGAYTVTLDDDPSIQKIIQRILGFSSLTFASSQGLLKKAPSLKPIAAFIDVHLDDNDTGLKIIPQLRRLWASTPIIVITSSPDDSNLAQALQSGADDFIQKPIRGSELKARTQRRIEEALERDKAQRIVFGDLNLDIKANQVQCPLGSVRPSPLVLDVLAALMLANGTTVSKQKLLAQVWRGTSVSNNAIDQKIREIRSLLKNGGSSISLVSCYGKGWKLDKGGHPQ